MVKSRGRRTIFSPPQIPSFCFICRVLKGSVCRYDSYSVYISHSLISAAPAGRGRTAMFSLNLSLGNTGTNSISTEAGRSSIDFLFFHSICLQQSIWMVLQAHSLAWTLTPVMLSRMILCPVSLCSRMIL
jgi:hypothetical protein